MTAEEWRRVEPMLWLKDYRADFQSPYLMADPLTFPKGTRLVLTTYVANATGEPITTEPRLSFVRVPTSLPTM